MTPELIAIAAVGATLFAALPALMVSLHNRTCQRIDALRSDLRSELRNESAEVRRELLASIDRRLARIEGAVLGPWRPSETEPEPT